MDAIKKSHEAQLQVRHNAEEMRNTLNDLYNWEQEIKAKERELTRHPDPTEKDGQRNVPIRSHILEQKQTDTNKVQQQQLFNSATVAKDGASSAATSSSATTPTEKTEKPLDPNEEKRKQANEVKDKGNKYVKLGEYEEAIYEYTTAIDIFPEDPVFYSNRALCYLKLERYNECIEDCERAIEIDSLTVKAYYRRMQANECLGNNLDALKDCTTVLMIEPKNSEANKSLERINERLRKNVKTSVGPSFSVSRDNMIDILPYDKPPYKRSSKQLRRVPIVDLIGPKRNCENLKISDDDIDKLFNSNCGPFVEIAKPNKNSDIAASKEDNPIDISSSDKPPYKRPNKQLRCVPATDLMDSKKNVANMKISGDHADKSLNSNCGPLPEGAKLNNSAESRSLGIAIRKGDQESELVDVLPSISNHASENKLSKDNQKTDVLLLNRNRPLPPAPTHPAQFYSNWKELAPAQKYQYLKSIDISKLSRVLGAGMDSETFMGVLSTLHDFYLPNKDETTAVTLQQVCKNSQVAILSLLLSHEEREIVKDIINVIKENEATKVAAEEISKCFNL
ncbi:RNA polymerase II-associated protein 3 isoform X1 [Anastrepha obliqua]|uniref:RNA polymerase II-associated protein 3 isoform X1 n=1 Tax=Anastrepha obliqua TaxID=95512 RepID=UPI002409BD79|nr:RNA polymerase II-associated protein 3 isoform X1 [Anastrepha obliqua]